MASSKYVLGVSITHHDIIRDKLLFSIIVSLCHRRCTTRGVDEKNEKHSNMVNGWDDVDPRTVRIELA